MDTSPPGFVSDCVRGAGVEVVCRRTYFATIVSRWHGGGGDKHRVASLPLEKAGVRPSERESITFILTIMKKLAKLPAASD